MQEHYTRDQAYELLIQAQERRQKARDTADEAGQIAAAKDCGIGHFYMEDSRLAIRLFDEAYRLIKQTGVYQDLLPTVIGMTGRALQRTKRWEEALEHYHQAAVTAEARQLLVQQLRWRGKEAKTLLDMQRPTEGIPKLEAAIAFGRALAVSGEPEGVEELAEQLSSLAAACEDTDQQRAERLWDEVFEHLEQLPPSRRHYLAATNYAVTLHKWGHDHQAQTYLDEALEIGRHIGTDHEELRQMAHRSAELLATLYGYETAGDWLMAQQSRFVEKQWEIIQHAVDLFERGFFWAKMRQAVMQWRALPIPTPIYAPLWQMEWSYSFACRGLGEHDAALTALDKARVYAQEWGNSEAIIAVQSQMVLVCVDRGDFQTARQLASDLWEAGGRDRLVVRALVEAFIGSGEIERVTAVREEFARGGGRELDVAWMNARLAEAGQGPPLEAWYVYGRAAREAKYPDYELEALAKLIALYAPQSEEKFMATRQRLRLIDKARTMVHDLFSDSAWYSVTQKAKDFPTYLDDFLHTAIAMGRHTEAVYELERFRSQMLVDLLSERSARWQQKAPEAMQARSYIINAYDRARYRFQGLLARGASWHERRTAAKDLDRWKGRTVGAGGIIHVAPGWQGLHFPQNFAMFFADMKLVPGEALLLLHVCDEYAAFWLMEANGQLHHTAVSRFTRATLTRLVQCFRHSCRNAAEMAERGARDVGRALPAVEAEDGLAELETILAKSLVEWLKQFALQRVFLITGTSATLLPLHASPSIVQAPLEIAVLPTSRALRFTREQRTPPSELFQPVNRFEFPHDFAAARDRLLLVVDPTHSLHFAPLEAAMVTLAAGTRTIAVHDQDNIDARHLCQNARVTDVFHMIVHGTFDDASPYRSGIYLKNAFHKERLWTIADILSEMDAPAGRLAVLSGCETGLTRPNLVSEEVSLPAAFLAAGFAAVIATKWVVDDFSTALLMGEFYQRWYSGGISICKALSDSAQWLRALQRVDAVTFLQSASQRLCDMLPEHRAKGWQTVLYKAIHTVADGPARPFGAPYYWAAFFVAGDGAISADGIDQRVPLTDSRGYDSRG